MLCNNCYNYIHKDMQQMRDMVGNTDKAVKEVVSDLLQALVDSTLRR